MLIELVGSQSEEQPLMIRIKAIFVAFILIHLF